MSTGVYREGSMLDGDAGGVAFTFFSLLLVLLVAPQLISVKPDKI